MKKLERMTYLRAEILLTSALLVACDSDDAADLTPIKDYEGNPFIPGTSLAGALRDFALKAGIEETIVNKLFGYTQKTGSLVQSFQSKIVIHDSHPLDSIHTATRDMVALNEKTKTAKDGAKFDVELIPRGAKFDLRLELSCFEGEEQQLVQYFYALADAMQKGHIRLGAKRKRGWGKFKLQNVRIESLNLSKTDDIKRWMDFSWDTIRDSQPDRDETVTIKPNMTSWEIPFSIPGALLIRSYQDFGDNDAVMFSEKGQTMIPGTSFNGCLRKACFDILYYDLKLERPNDILNKLFGFVDASTKKSQASMLFIEDIILETNQKASYSRNKINRFTGGAEDGALFTTEPVYNSQGTITISFDSSLESWARQLLYYALMDIGTGVVPLGGETAIGRGIINIDTQMLEKPESGEIALSDYLKDFSKREATT